MMFKEYKKITVLKKQIIAIYRWYNFLYGKPTIRKLLEIKGISKLAQFKIYIKNYSIYKNRILKDNT